MNEETGQFWVIDYRLYDPDNDGKTKLDHVQEMLESARVRQLRVRQLPEGEGLPFHTVLMDSWYATRDLMLLIAGWKKPGADHVNTGQVFY